MATHKEDFIAGALMTQGCKPELARDLASLVYYVYRGFWWPINGKPRLISREVFLSFCGLAYDVAARLKSTD
jgi:hypothetical protein